VAETVALDVVGLGVLAHSHLFVSIRREEEITTGRQKKVGDNGNVAKQERGLFIPHCSGHGEDVPKLVWIQDNLSLGARTHDDARELFGVLLGLAVEREGAASRVDAPQLDDLVISPGGQKGPISAPGNTAYQVGVVVVVGALLLPLQPKESLLSRIK
jgi:hypothetical protein